jgi:phosphoenolpyruvate-protein phosphotransferase/dihydroxyacetone kinase phosphotransfer subunit
VVSLVIVSHSAALASGVVELAREMGGGEVQIEAAGGMEDGALGTDAARVFEAVERVRSSDGVLVLMDLGSALMSAEMATEMADPDGGPILLSEAPLVEGAVAAVARARGGASLEEVAREARGALAMKSAQLGSEGGDEPDAGAAPTSDDGPGAGAAPASGDEPGAGAARGDGGEVQELRLRVDARLGLHARPAARFVGALGGIDARVAVTNETRGRGPADGRSLTGLATLAVRQGDEIVVSASGAGADDALVALRALAAENFGDPREEGEAPAAAPEDGAPAKAPPMAAAPAGARDSGAPGSPPSAGAAGAPASPTAPGSRLRGIPASAGIAIGPARRLRPQEPPVEDDPVGAPDEERARLEAALAAVRDELEEVRASVTARGGAAEADIFTAHAMLLDDAAITEPALRRIGEGASAGRAWREATREAAAAFRALDDAYMRERAVDVEDVAARVLAQLAGVPSGVALEGPGIVVADELTPRETAGLDPADAWAIATARGGATAHAAILARALGIPAVVGVGGPLLAIAEETPLVVDGDAGVVEIDPDADTIAEHEQRRAAAEADRRALLALAAEPASLRDGRRVEVFANVGNPAEARAALEQGAEGIGLLRTEFLFLDRATPPTEDEQAEVLREIAGALDGRPVVVRTLDTGADKPLRFLPQDPEANPFLGRRGIRLSLSNPDLLRTQLRAILRVAAEHPLKVMFPMVATLEELRAARALLDEARAELGSHAELELGVMVEVPALALQAAGFAQEVDFFSIGTNDLAQYVMAADRGNAALADLLSGSLAPVLALVAAVTAAAAAAGRWVGVCGELAGDPHAAVLLAGLGVRELSMAGSRVPAVKAALRAVDWAEAESAARGALPPLPERAARGSLRSGAR